MELSFAAVADYANVTQEGKLNLMGIFERIQGAAFPLRHSSMVFAFRLRLDHADQNEAYQVRVQLVDDQGKATFNTTGTIKVGAIGVNEFRSANQVMDLRDVTFEKPGTYRFSVSIPKANIQREIPFLVAATS